MSSTSSKVQPIELTSVLKRNDSYSDVENEECADISIPMDISANSTNRVSFSNERVRPKFYATDSLYVAADDLEGFAGMTTIPAVLRSEGDGSASSSEHSPCKKRGSLHGPRGPMTVHSFGRMKSGVEGSSTEGSISGASTLVSKALKNSRVRRWWHSVSLMKKMCFVVGIPIMMLFIITILQLEDNIDLIEVREAEDKFSKYAKVVEVVIQDLDVENEFTQLMYIDDSAENEAALLLQRQNKTDVSRRAFLQFVEDGGMSLLPTIRASRAYDDLLNYVIGLEQHRTLVDQRRVTADESLEYYVKITHEALASTWYGFGIASDPEVKNLIVMHSILEDSLQHFTQEIIYGTRILHAGKVESVEKLLKYSNIVAQAQLLEELYLHVQVALEDNPKVVQVLAGIDFTDVLDEIMGITAVREIITSNDTVAMAEIEWQTYAQNGTAVLKEVTNQALILLSGVEWMTQMASDESNIEITALGTILGVVIIVSVLLTYVMVSSINFANKILREEVKKRRTTEKAIWRFFPQEFMTLLNKTNILNIQQGDRKRMKMCVMFSDIRNFTKVSEQLGAEQTYDWLMDYVQAMGPIIKRHHGFIDKTLGDGIMALFTNSQDALQCAIAMQVEAEKMNLDNTGTCVPPYNVGIGLHTGDVILGVIGDRHRLEGTTVSDTVNTASRIEGLCKVYQSRIIISQATFDDCDMIGVDNRYLGSVKLLGKTERLDIYDVFQSDPPMLQEYKSNNKETFESAVRAFQSGNFSECQDSLRMMQDSVPSLVDGGLDQRVLQCNEFMRNGPPEEWSGEDVMTSK